MISDHFPSVQRFWHRAGGRPRQVLAAVLAAAGLLLVVVPHQRRPSVAERAVVVAARPVPAGVVLRAADVRVARLPTDIVPRAALVEPAAAIGESPTAALETGDLLTARTLLSSAISASLQRGLSAIAVTLAGIAQLAVLHPGARIDLYSAGATSSPGEATAGVTGSGAASANGSAVAAVGNMPVASDIEVLSVLGDASAASAAATEPAGQTASIIIGCDRATAARIASFGTQFVAALRA